MHFVKEKIISIGVDILAPMWYNKYSKGVDNMNEKFYAVQMQVDGFGHDTATMICFHTKNECEDWINKNSKEISENLGYSVYFEIVEQEFGTDFEEVFG